MKGISMTLKTKLALATAGVLGTITFLGATNKVEAGEIATDGGTQWEVQQGDTLSAIANNYGIDYAQIHDSNSKIEDPNQIFVGEVLDIPVKTQQQKEVEEYFASRGQEDVVQQPQEAEEVEQPVEEPVVEEPVQEQAEVAEPEPAPEPETEVSGSENGSVKEQFLAAGGTESMWNSIVIPESGGDPNAVNELGYRGLGQTKESWGTGSVKEQTEGMIQYGIDRYGSIENAVSERDAQGWW